MNSIGNKIVATLCLVSSSALAEEIELTTFSANTPAKAEEVNGNFEALKEKITELQTELGDLRTSVPQPDEYSVPVYSDGVLIGHTQRQPAYYRAPDLKLLNYGSHYVLDEQDGEVFTYIPKGISSLTGFFLDSECSSKPIISSTPIAHTFAYDPNYELTENTYVTDNQGAYYVARSGTKLTIAERIYVMAAAVHIDYPNPYECLDLDITNQLVFNLQKIDKSEITIEFRNITIEGYQSL